MTFTETSLPGAYVLEMEFLRDERGFFARALCSRELEDRGLCSRFVQYSISFNHVAGTLRGMHYQVAPHEEVKIIRCTRGAIWDVILDLRPRSTTFGKWFGLELTEENYKMLYVPAGFAHGFQTLSDRAEVVYQISAFYSADHARGVRWDDPAFEIGWPREPTVMSAKDRGWSDYSPLEE